MPKPKHFELVRLLDRQSADRFYLIDRQIEIPGARVVYLIRVRDEVGLDLMPRTDTVLTDGETCLGPVDFSWEALDDLSAHHIDTLAELVAIAFEREREWKPLTGEAGRIALERIRQFVESIN